MKISFANPSIPEKGVLVLSVSDGQKFGDLGKALDKQTGGSLMRAVKASKFKGNKTQVLHILAPSGSKLDRIILIGLGKDKDLNDLACQSVGGQICATLNAAAIDNASVVLETTDKSAMAVGDIAANVAYGARLRSYRFDKYRTTLKTDEKPSLKTLKIAGGGVARAKTQFAMLDKVADGVFMTRDLVSEPANMLYPESMAKEIKTLSKLGIKVSVLNETQMEKLGMGALLGVGQGSVRQSRLVVMRWDGVAKPKKIAKGKKANDRPIAFVGKGVTFDTGGISLKPAGGMEDMKWDMGGSAVVTGLMKALAGRKAKVNVVGVVGLVENMPGANAQRPGDIVTSMSGQTIEVLNTDAEGRLVLADALHYTRDHFDPKFMVNLATLTGAIIIALGSEHAGLFSNNDELSERLTEAGKAVDEKVWRFPMNEAYDKTLNCDVADMKNISGGRGAGSITAAQFLKRFVGDTPWAHLDIAGVTWSKKDSATVPKGGTAFGVRLLNQLVADHYESK